ncbi:transcriptional regulator BetI [Paracoccus sp. p3-h83]|uniref:choline-binding transcriptional repressor BetI n=1 Tax=Paracoccus sp. p3-h83 TaxID=3342805 RepID=UPI0035B8F3C1
MPKIGAEPIRRAALVKAAIAAVGEAGSLDVTVAQIARRAGMSSALAHHYFGSKDQIFLAAMRQILSDFGAEVRRGLALAGSRRARLGAVIAASFTPVNFQPEIIGAWMSFYAMAHSSPEARRLLVIYQNRLRSTLLHDLRPLIGTRAPAVAEGVAALIDGMYLRAALAHDAPDGDHARDLVLGHLARELTHSRGDA